MCFYIGQAHQASPPEPEAPVTVETRSITVFVETYSGYMKDCDWAKKVKVLFAGNQLYEL